MQPVETHFLWCVQPLNLIVQLLVSTRSSVGNVGLILLINRCRDRVIPASQPPGVLPWTPQLDRILFQLAQEVWRDRVARQASRLLAGSGLIEELMLIEILDDRAD